jgi:hypothetical protein
MDFARVVLWRLCELLVDGLAGRLISDVEGVCCMRYWKLFGVAVVAVCALGASLAVSAFALPTILPETIKTFTGKSIANQTAVLETANGSTVTCKSATAAEGTVEQPKPLGLFHIHFKECTGEASGLKASACTGLGDEEKTILSLGSWHLVYDHLGTSLSEAGVAILFLLDNVHFVCNFEIVGAQLILVPLGSMVLCLITNPTTLQATFEFKCKGTAAKGVTEESKYYNSGGTLVSISTLLSAVNEGTNEQSVEKALGTIEFPVAALLMI